MFRWYETEPHKRHRICIQSIMIFFISYENAHEKKKKRKKKKKKQN